MKQMYTRAPNKFEEIGVARQEQVLFLNLPDDIKKQVADKRKEHSCELCALRRNGNCSTCPIPGANENVKDTIDRGIMRVAIDKIDKMPKVKKDKSTQILEIMRSTASEYKGMANAMTILFERLQEAGLLEEG